jgi:hypothetical protein
MSVSPWLIGLLGLVAVEQPAGAQNVALTAFVGTWVGTQTWAIDNPPPGVNEPQPVTLTIELVDGQLVGTLLPFMGGSDGATFTGGVIVGDQLQVIGSVGKPQLSSEVAGRGRGRGWKESIQIRFVFRPDRNNLTGTADVLMNDVKWLKFKYDLGRKRSRY